MQPARSSNDGMTTWVLNCREGRMGTPMGVHCHQHMHSYHHIIQNTDHVHSYLPSQRTCMHTTTTYSHSCHHNKRHTHTFMHAHTWRHASTGSTPPHTCSNRPAETGGKEQLPTNSCSLLDTGTRCEDLMARSIASSGTNPNRACVLQGLTCLPGQPLRSVTCGGIMNMNTILFYSILIR